MVSSDTNCFAGGLVGIIEGSAAEAGYYNSEMATLTNSTNTIGVQSTAALQGTTSFVDIYEKWGDSGVWHLGTAAEYPLLHVDFDGNGTPIADELWPASAHRRQYGW